MEKTSLYSSICWSEEKENELQRRKIKISSVNTTPTWGYPRTENWSFPFIPNPDHKNIVVTLETLSAKLVQQAH